MESAHVSEGYGEGIFSFHKNEEVLSRLSVHVFEPMAVVTGHWN